jgi:hypothetical protein
VTLFCVLHIPPIGKPWSGCIKHKRLLRSHLFEREKDCLASLGVPNGSRFQTNASLRDAILCFTHPSHWQAMVGLYKTQKAAAQPFV